MQFMANDSGFGSANVDEALDTDPSVDRTLTVPAPGSSPFKTARMQGTSGIEPPGPSCSA